MNLSDLLSKGLVEKFQSDPTQIKKEMDIATSESCFCKKDANHTGIELGS